MKKLFALMMTAVMALSALSITVFAADAKFVDTLEDNYPLVHEKSEEIRFENNKDIEATLYGKWGETPTAAAKKTMFVTYKLNGTVTGFQIHALFCNGFGDPDKDLSFFVSKDNKTWTAVPAKHTELTYDDEIYLEYDKAYWLMSDFSNKAAIPAGYSYFKIQFNPYTKQNDCPNWSAELDTVTINYKAAAGTTKATTTTKKPGTTTKAPAGGTTATTADVGGNASEDASQTTQDSLSQDVSATDTTQSNADETSTGESTAATTAADTQTKPASNLTWLYIVLGVVVLAGAGVGVFFFLKAKKSK